VLNDAVQHRINGMLATHGGLVEDLVLQLCEKLQVSAAIRATSLIEPASTA
jgi:hypothetical protein